jgi:hypothetical protein
MTPVGNPTPLTLPDGIPEVQRELRGLKRGGTVKIVTADDVPMSFSQTPKGLVVDASLPIPCVQAEALAEALFALGAFGAFVLLSASVGPVVVLNGIPIAATVLAIAAERIANGIKFDPLVRFLAKNVCR